jgi:hypothetical protein
VPGVDGSPAVDAAAIGRIFREESGRCVASLIRVFGDIDVAEDAVQEAFAVALGKWRIDDLPPNPGGWITTTARNRAIDRLRRESRGRDLLDDVAVLSLDTDDPETSQEEAHVSSHWTPTTRSTQRGLTFSPGWPAQRGRGRLRACGRHGADGRRAGLPQARWPSVALSASSQRRFERELAPGIQSADTGGMTASRTCRACGADLRGDVMWCLRCLEPVRQLTPREGNISVASFVNSRPDAARSRWKAGATSFGPVGRIAISVGVLLFFPPTLGNPVTLFVYLPAYLAIAAVVLRSTWKKDVVERPVPVEEPAGEPRPEPVVEPVPTTTIVAWSVLIAIGLGVAIAWTAMGSQGRGLIGIGVSLAALVLAFRWFMRP